MGNRKKQHCEMLGPEFFLPEKQIEIWDCFSEYYSTFNGRLHFHDFYEMSIIYEGRSSFLINGSQFHLGTRSLQLVRPSDYHLQMVEKGDYIRYYNLIFSADLLSEPLRNLLESCDGALCTTASESDWKDLRRLLRKMLEAFPHYSEDLLAQVFIRCNVENLCLYLLKNKPLEPIAHTETMQEPIRRALTYTQNNYRSPIRLTDVAAAAGLSPSYFSALFHDAMGIPYSSYLNGYRLRIAERYLRSSDLSVKQIAAAYGFRSYPYFVSSFKEAYGMSPGSWRSQADQAGES